MVFKLMATATAVQLHDQYTKNSWRTLGEHLENTWRMFWGHLGNSWRTHDKHTMNTLRTLRTPYDTLRMHLEQMPNSHTLLQ